MSSKLVLGIAAGILSGIGIGLLLMNREEESYVEEELSDGFDNIDKGSRFMNEAKVKTEKLVRDAEEKSNSILEEASKILISAKEKISKIHFESEDIAKEEIEKVKKEVDMSIEEFKNKVL